jgi:hypothetical protein
MEITGFHNQKAGGNPTLIFKKNPLIKKRLK